MKRIASFAAFATCTMLASEGTAGFRICNQTLEMANVAIGQSEQGQFLTRGWWKVGPNQCADVIREPLAARFLYVYASDIFGKELLNGSVSLCIGPERFVISGQEDCALRGHVSVKFIEVDTNSAQEWTLFLASPVE